MSRKSLKDKIIIVSGASGGIGAETCRMVASLGATCILANRPNQCLMALADEITQSNPRSFAVEADLSVWNSWTDLAGRVEDTFGRIDVLVHCVGILVPYSLETMDEQSVDEIVSANLVSTMYGIKAVLPVMKRQQHGHIIVVGSLGGIVPMPFQAVYSATKFGVRGLCLSLHEELRRSGIYVSLIAPGPVRTRMLITETDDDRASIAFSNPPLEPAAVAKSIVSVLQSPRQEVVLPKYLSIVSRFVGMFPGVLTMIYPLLNYFGARRMRYFRNLNQKNHEPVMQTE